MRKYRYAMIEARSKAGLSQLQLAHMSGLNQCQISSYEAGKHVPSITAVAALADALGISIDEYIGREI